MNTHRSLLAALLTVVTLAATMTTSFAGDPPAAAPSTQDVVKSAAKPELIYSETANANSDIAAALVRAKRNNTRVLLQWGANWCGWCKWFHASCKTDSSLARELRYEYEVVLIDVGQFDKHQDLTAKYGVDLNKNGVPFLTVLAADGSVVTNQESSSLEKPADANPKGHDVAKVLAFFKANQAPALNANEVLAAAVASAKSQDKLVFLHFGAPWCGWCHRLEDWMAKPEIAAIFAKAFVDVKIDTDRMSNGEEVLKTHSQGKNGGIPWCEILDGQGTALVNSNASSGNIGFPAQPEEIAWFVQMLTKSNARISAEDIAVLQASLTPPAKTK